MLIACAGSTLRIWAHFVQLRSTEPREEISIPSMSKRMPLQRISTGEEAIEEAMHHCIETPLRLTALRIRLPAARRRSLAEDLPEPRNPARRTSLHPASPGFASM